MRSSVTSTPSLHPHLRMTEITPVIIISESHRAMRGPRLGDTVDVAAGGLCLFSSFCLVVVAAAAAADNVARRGLPRLPPLPHTPSPSVTRGQVTQQ